MLTLMGENFGVLMFAKNDVDNVKEEGNSVSL
jgi:hypothetical protein